jgi:hypothetical protein
MHTPYRDAATNRLYNALFCDDTQLLLPPEDHTLTAWQRALMGGPAFAGALRRRRESRGLQPAARRGAATHQSYRQRHPAPFPSPSGCGNQRRIHHLQQVYGPPRWLP